MLNYQVSLRMMTMFRDYCCSILQDYENWSNKPKVLTKAKLSKGDPIKLIIIIRTFEESKNHFQASSLESCNS